MKKFLGLVLAGVMALALSTAVDAASGLRVVDSQKTTVEVNSGGRIDVNRVETKYYYDRRIDYGTFTYFKVSDLFIDATALENLKNALKNNDAFQNWNPQVLEELVAINAFSDREVTTGVVNASYVNWNELEKNIQRLGEGYLDKNIIDVARNIVPGRNAGLNVNGTDVQMANNSVIIDENGNKIQLKTDGSITATDYKTAQAQHRVVVSDYSKADEYSGTKYYMDSGVIKRTAEYTTYQLAYDIYEAVAIKYVSPLVLDMTGSGKLEASNGNHLPHRTLDISNAIITDFYGDGFEVAMEWVGPNDGLLVMPKADGTVDMTTLFGTATGFESGYEALSILDENKDRLISGNELAGLAVWQDKNHNGIADAGEVTSVQELGITKISLDEKNFVSSFERNGNTYKMWDWWPSAMELTKVAAK